MGNGKKATIITIYDPMPNLGNRLQNFAVQEVLRRMGFHVDTVAYQKSALSFKDKMKWTAQRLSGYRLPGDKSYWKLFPKRVRVFEQFNKKHIKTQRIKKIKSIQPADFFVLGSDQVWNPQWYGDCDLKMELFLLTFAKPEQKVCFSPSFGIDRLPMEWKSWFQEKLSLFPILGVREDAGKTLIKELTGKDATVMLDPTLMLTKKEWNNLAVKPKNIDTDKEYILTYFLGGRTKKIDIEIEKYAKGIGAEVYNLLDMTQENLYIVDPSEFLYLVAHSKLVVTDSFHACVFSFIFAKPFLVYERIGGQNMMSRMNTLLEKFNLQRKYVGSDLKNELLECDYRKGYEILEREQDRTMNFLMDAFKRSL